MMNGLIDEGRELIDAAEEGDVAGASVLIAANLVDLGIPHIWAKAMSQSHGKILERIGVHHVIYPEREAGEIVEDDGESHNKIIEFLETVKVL